MRVWDGSITTANSRPSAHGLRLGRSNWPSSSALTEPGARWSWLVDGTHGEAEYADGSDEVDAARRARARHSTRRLRVALSGLAEVAQSEVVQLVFAEAVVARLPAGRTRAGRRAALVGTVWMLDPKRRAATHTIARTAVEWTRVRMRDGAARRDLANAALGEVERLSGQVRRHLDSPR